MKVLAVIGNPINHSKSPRIHNNAIKFLGLDAIYTRYLLNDKSLLKEKFLKLRLNGANITIPFKEEALNIADIKDENVVKIGSANTLILKDNKIYAYNTDAPGFLQSIKDYKDIKKALILGAGGSAKAIAFALNSKNIKCTIANRSSSRFKDFKDYKTSLYENLQDFEFDIVINTTPAGLNNDNLPCDENLLNKLLSNAKFGCDIVYGKQTPFLNACKKHKLIFKDGADMLLWQGVFAFELFFDIKDKETLIKQAMQEALTL
ncbi:shikimate dehydrogenase [Campylobacter sp. LR264d]|uniref:shikimate dehydrogenase n=1 Tax=Campylobacter sp. LR264d TaxID=2593544 RepID=UPI001239D027|nr:shikimate dehydrogenase [Campylobacter sp. LR264d]KAA6234212.1 shikimate dehydrogenase [Campylobacter sp. LR264d]